jgi:MFS family permease
MRINRAWLGAALLMLPTLLVAMDTTALLLALPRLSAGLGATNVQQLWISDGYGFLVASLVITMGTLGDRIGRRRLLIIGAAGFAVLSVVAAFAVSPLMLIVVRALLGVAGATLAPSTLALITNMFRDEQERGKAIAIWATCQFTGGALGPVLGGDLAARCSAMIHPGGTIVSAVDSQPRAPAGTRGVFFVVEPGRSQLTELAQLADTGKLRPVVAKQVPMADGAADGFVAKHAGGIFGKIVLQPG